MPRRACGGALVTSALATAVSVAHHGYRVTEDNSANVVRDSSFMSEKAHLCFHLHANAYYRTVTVPAMLANVGINFGHASCIVRGQFFVLAKSFGRESVLEKVICGSFFFIFLIR